MKISANSLFNNALNRTIQSLIQGIFKICTNNWQNSIINCTIVQINLNE